MKRSDWTLIIAVAFLAAFAAFSATNSLTSGQRKPNEKVDTAGLISDQVSQPANYVYGSDDKIKSPINPTIMVTTGSGVQPGESSTTQVQPSQSTDSEQPIDTIEE